jgi:HD-like signal output (HDOD) protein
MAVTTDPSDVLIAKVLEGGASLPPLPANGARLLAALRKPLHQVNVQEIAKLIENDPSLAARVLRIANSAFYGSTNQIKSLSQAIMRLGLVETINTVSFFVLRETLPEFPTLEKYSCEDFWAHSWACAMAGRLLSHPEHRVQVLPGELYMAGLLHGIGKLVLVLHCTEKFGLCLQEARRHNLLLREAEREILGFTDAILGAKLLKAWNLPHSIRTAVGTYPAPNAAAEEHREIAALTQLAHLIANRCGLGHSGDGRDTELERSWYVRQGTGPLAQVETLERIAAETRDAVRKKSALIVGIEAPAPEDSAELQAQPAGSGRSLQRPARPARQSGLGRRLGGFFRSLLH